MDGSIFIDQSLYVEKILNRFRMDEANSEATPMEKSNENNVESHSVKGDVLYREAAGSIMYLTIATRPDIAYAVTRVCQYLEDPKQSNCTDVKRIFKYLEGTENYGLLYKRNHNTGILEAYTDSNFAGDKETRRSRNGFVSKYSGASITWASKKQRSVVLSTTEAEYVAAKEGVKELIWLKRLLRELTELKEIPTLLVDYANAIKLAKNPEFHKHSKHIEVRFHFLREKFREGIINIDHVKGEEQVADIMTEPLGRVKFEKLKSLLGLE